MKYISKIEPDQPYSVETWSATTRWDPDHPNGYQSSPAAYMSCPSGRHVITYAKGPIYSHGHVVWKECTHDVSKAYRGAVGTELRHVGYARPNPSYSYEEEGSVTFHQLRYTTPPYLRKAVWDPQSLVNAVNQIDLNCRESVLLYSGILQAVPLLGGCLRLNAILREVAKKTRKSFQRQPFTTVLKSAISADFVDRFVVSPTLDDARRFADATNYVLRVLNTALDRNAAPTALSGEVKTVFRDDKSTYAANSQSPSYEEAVKVGCISKAFIWVDVRYDIDAISKINLYATRVGLTRPLDSVWDLVPFSFVVDYFARAGDFISQLGDEMSDQDGLKGRVLRVRDCWRTFYNYATLSAVGKGPTTWTPSRTGEFRPSSFSKHWSGGKEMWVTSHFERLPISNPFATLASLESTSGGLLRWDLSLTRARTIAQLIIQAKL